MNRYRSVPGLGPQKASASTTCQKCLKKGHYSYECKASLQQRPYASRPSRSQLFKNPKLAPPLASEKKDDLISSEGVADKVLADAEVKRNGEAEGRRSPSPGQGSLSRRRSRSSSVDSVSTISTNRAKSRSPPRRGDHDFGKKNGRSPSRSLSRSRGRKRRHESVSSSSRSLSRSPPPRTASHHKNRRHRTISPDDRGRPHSLRRGSRRSRSGSGSGSMSVDKSRITKQRRLMSEDEDVYVRAKENERPQGDGYHPRRGEKNAPERDELDRRRDDGYLQRDAGGSHGGGRDRHRYGNGNGAMGRENARPKERRERSLSPYSRRLALTQAMNISR